MRRWSGRARLGTAVALIASLLAVVPAVKVGGATASWTLVGSPNTDVNRDNTLTAIARVSATDVWAVGYANNGTVDQSLTEHYDGTSWNIVPSVNTSATQTNRLLAVVALASNDVWAVGYSNDGVDHALVEHWNGLAWSIIGDAGATRLTSVAAIASNDVWAVGDGNTGPFTEHWNGSSWSDGGAASTTGTLRAVAADATNDVWAVGSDGTVPIAWDWNGTSWISHDPATTGTLGSVATIAANDVWAVGATGTQTLALHWDGAAWTQAATPNPGASANDFSSVATIASNDVWAVGSSTSSTAQTTLVAHFDGTSWSAATSANNGSGANELAAVAAVSTNDVWAVGSFTNGSIAQTEIETTRRTSATTIAASANPSVAGQAVTYTATVTGPDVPATGGVTFTDGTADVCTNVAVVAGSASCTTSYPGTGSHAITATYNGDANYTASSASLSQLVDAAATTTSVSSSANPSAFGAAVTYTATVNVDSPGNGSPTGTVTFTDDAVTVCPNAAVTNHVATCTAAPSSAGAHTISAQYGGDANFAGSTGTATQNVSAGTATMTLTADASSAVLGQSVTYTATLAPVSPATATPTGAVTFLDGTTTLCNAVALSNGTAMCTNTMTTGGSHSVTANYSGDPNYAATTGSTTVTVSRDNTTTTVTASANPSVVGESVTYTATVAVVSPATGTPTGTVTFAEDGSAIGACTSVALTNGEATCARTYTTNGLHTIVATYDGDTNDLGSASSDFVQAVNAAPTATTVTSSSGSVLPGEQVTYTAAVSVPPPGSGTASGAVTFFDGGSPIGGCANVALTNGEAQCSATYAAVGTHLIDASYGGNTDFAASSSNTLSETVAPGATTTALNASDTGVVTGQMITLSATVAPTAPASGALTGTITFADAGTPINGCAALALGTGSATCVTAFAHTGTHDVTATYTGDTNFATSTSNTVTIGVLAAATTTTVTPSANPAAVGEPVTYIASVVANAPGAGTPDGTLSFADNGLPIAACTSIAMSSGGASCQQTYATPGTHSITVAYSGSADYASSSSAALGENVTPATTTVAIGSSVDPAVVGQSVTYTATVTVDAPGSGTPTGTVSFTDGTTPIASCNAVPVNGATAACTTSYPNAGTHTVTALYSGDGNFTSGTSPTLVQGIDAAATNTQLTSSAATVVTGQAITFTASVARATPATGTPTGTVSFYDDGTSIGSCTAVPLFLGVANCDTTLAGAGVHAITAAFNGTADDAPSASAALSQPVDPAATTTTISSSINPTLTGQATTFTVSVTVNAPGTGTATGTVTFMDGTSAIPSCTDVALTDAAAVCAEGIATAGAHDIVAVYAGTADDSASTSAVLVQNVDAGATTTTLSSSANPSVTGQALTLHATVSAVSPAAGEPTGVVVFVDGTTPITGCTSTTLNAGVATCDVQYGTVSTHNIVATYGGDANFATSPSAQLTQTVASASTTITVTPSANPQSAGHSITFDVGVTADAPGSGIPTGIVDLSANGVPLSGCTGLSLQGGNASCAATFSSVGVEMIVATYSGDANYATSTSVAVAQFVVAVATSSAIGADVNPSVTGQPVTYSATVVAVDGSTPTGTVAFAENGTVLASCAAVPVVANSASCTVPFATAGPRTVDATYSGDDAHAQSSASLSQVVNAAATTTALDTSPNPSVAGQPVTLHAAVTATAPGAGTPAASVDFLDSGIAVPSCTGVATTNGVATCSTALPSAGAHAFSAVFSGDADYIGSTSATVTQVVDPSATTVAVSSSANPSVAGEQVTYDVSVTPAAPGTGLPTGSVDFNDGSPIAGCTGVPLVSGAAQCSVQYTSATSRAISVAYSGDANFLPANGAMTQVVQRAETSTTVSAGTNPVLAGTTVSYTASVAILAPGSGTLTGSVTFAENGTLIAGCGNVVVAGANAECVTTQMAAGDFTITASYNGDANTNASTSAPITETATAGSLSLASTSGNVTLTPVQLTGAPQTSAGTLDTVRVNDNRGTLAGWTVTGQLETDFTLQSAASGLNDVIPASNLTWSPRVAPTNPGAPNVDAGAAGPLSVSSARVLCYALNGTGGASYDCGADLGLTVPASAHAGSYSAVLDIVVY